MLGVRKTLIWIWQLVRQTRPNTSAIRLTTKWKSFFGRSFHNPERPLSVSDHLAAWAELNRLSGLAMKHVVSHLWPKRPEPKSYFSLVQQLLGAVPHINAMKRSACIEGAQMALARVKTYWAEMKAIVVASQD